jgi:UDP-2-acetamido-2-deoxy-ribo-hexuluronate aminotransferase
MAALAKSPGSRRLHAAPEEPAPAGAPPGAIPFVDLAAQRRRLGPRLDAAIARVLAHGCFIMGPEVAELEAQLAAFCGARHAIACASGTDALALGLMAKGIGPGDAVLMPGFTFVATAEPVAWLGAVPVFIDVLPDTCNLDPARLEQGVRTARAEGLTPRAVIAVDLFGQPADYDPIEEICARHRLWLMADAAQSFGASYGPRRVGTLGAITATSFFPSKPLGCYGDGGCVFTDDDELAEAMRSLRVHGQGRDKYDNVRIGMNARLDTVQAAILLEKLAIFPDELEARQRVAEGYEVLRGLVQIPCVIAQATSVWAQYTVVVERIARDALAAALKAAGIATAVYYPTPLHQQSAYHHYPVAGGALPVAERLSRQVLSLPIHSYLEPATQALIIAALRRALGEVRPI